MDALTVSLLILVVSTNFTLIGMVYDLRRAFKNHLRYLHGVRDE